MRVRLVRRLLALLMLGLALGASPGAGAADDLGRDGQTGVSGRVVLEMRCPVPLGGDDGICPEVGIQTDVVVRTPDGLAEVARAASDPDGAFWIPLDPGAYLIDLPLLPAPAEPQVQANGQLPVTVGADGPTPLTIHVPVGRGTLP